MSAAEASKWHAWRRDRMATLVDAADAGDDHRPFTMDLVQHLHWFARHPRAFVRMAVKA